MANTDHIIHVQINTLPFLCMEYNSNTVSKASPDCHLNLETSSLIKQTVEDM